MQIDEGADATSELNSVSCVKLVVIKNFTFVVMSDDNVRHQCFSTTVHESTFFFIVLYFVLTPSVVRL